MTTRSLPSAMGAKKSSSVSDSQTRCPFFVSSSSRSRRATLSLLSRATPPSFLRERQGSVAGPAVLTLNLGTL